MRHSPAGDPRGFPGFSRLERLLLLFSCDLPPGRVDQKRFAMRFLVFVLILFAIFHVALLFKLAFALFLAVALALGFWVLWRLKWVILAIFGLEELFGNR
jgi:hypothetical protein